MVLLPIWVLYFELVTPTGIIAISMTYWTVLVLQHVVAALFVRPQSIQVPMMMKLSHLVLVLHMLPAMQWHQLLRQSQFTSATTRTLTTKRSLETNAYNLL